MKKKIILGIVFSLITITLLVFGFILSPNSNQNVELFTGSKTLSFILFILGALMSVVAFGYIFNLFSKLTIKELAVISVQAALSILLYYLPKIPYPIFPVLEVHVSEIPALITSYIYGPFAGILIILIRFFVKAPASTTVFVGELTDLILGLAIVLISSLIYKKKRTFKGAVIGSIISMISVTFLACLVNIFISIPFYMEYYHLDYIALASMMKHVSFVNENNFMLYYILIAVIPFNLIRLIIVYLITFILYKRTHRLFVLLTKQ